MMHSMLRQRGFTLLELLIAMVIVALVMTAAFGGVRIGGRSLETGHERADATEEMRAVSEFLHRQVSQSEPLLWEDEAGKRIAFEGSEEGFRFLAPAPFDSGSVGLLEFSVSIDSTNTARLRLAYDPFDPGALEFGSAPAVGGLWLTPAFDSVALAYFGAMDTDGPTAWYPEWPSSSATMPKLIRISFGAATDANEWPELILPLRSREAL
jgi:general secretion pathway protein J